MIITMLAEIGAALSVGLLIWIATMVWKSFQYTKSTHIVLFGSDELCLNHGLVDIVRELEKEVEEHRRIIVELCDIVLTNCNKIDTPVGLEDIIQKFKNQ